MPFAGNVMLARNNKNAVKVSALGRSRLASQNNDNGQPVAAVDFNF